MRSERPVVHQVIVGASEGDAITHMALNLRDGLRQTCDSEVFAFWRHGLKMEKECKHLAEMPDSSEVDVLIYHLSIGLPEVHEFILGRSERMVLSYHNITPSHFYASTNPDFAQYLELGRKEVEILRSRSTLALADSEFNAGELVAAGYENVRVIPAGLDSERLSSLDFASVLAGRLRSRFPNGYVVAVGQVLPHKRIDQLLTTMHLMNSTYWENIGLVVCGAARQETYWASVRRFRQRAAMVYVLFTGAVTDKELATYIRCARAFLGMSDHEGFCIPPMEAASMSVPVVIKGAAAVPETIADGALLLPADASPVIAAEALHEVLNNHLLRSELIFRGLLRVRELHERKPTQATIKAIMELAL